MLLRGVVGGLLRAAAGAYLLYATQLFQGLSVVLDDARAGVEAADSLGGLAGALWEAASSGVSALLGGLPSILVALVLWVVGGFLLNSGWGLLSRLWPGWVRLLFKVLDVVVGVILIFALLYPLRLLYLLASNAGLEDLLPSVRLLTLLYLAPLSLPILKAGATLYYSTGGKWSRTGILLLAAGGAIYLYTMYLVYTAFNPLQAVVAHIRSMPLEPGVEQARQIALAGIEALSILLERTKTVVQALTLASILYTLGFTLIKEDLGLKAKIINVFRVGRRRASQSSGRT